MVPRRDLRVDVHDAWDIRLLIPVALQPPSSLAVIVHPAIGCSRRQVFRTKVEYGNSAAQRGNANVSLQAITKAERVKKGGSEHRLTGLH